MRHVMPGVNTRGDAVCSEQVAQRRIPAMLVVDAADRVIMATEQAHMILQEFEQVNRVTSHFGDLPAALKAAVGDLRDDLKKRPDSSAIALLGADLCVRVCWLSSSFGTYLLLFFERLKRSNSIPLNLARYHLTPREFQAALLAIQGLSNRSIANKLYLSESTVEGYLKHIYNKIEVHSRAGLVAKLLGSP